ncbi:MAG: SDR family oxidoreductase [Sphingobacteriales bacterium]|nr:SDR family oxidoreductase [Sphingobacteriales bacterium]MCC7222413.1 SDR family oxidoreductase [Chitinophagales bacterium]
MLLNGKRGIIFGALDEKSIAWKIAERAYQEGATFTLSNAPVALRMGSIQRLADQCQTSVIAADATDTNDLKTVFEQSIEQLGGKIDFVLHAIGMSPNVRKNREYTNLNYAFYAQTIDISAMSFHKILQTAWQLDALNDGASVIALSYIAAQRSFPGYNDMADAKAALESIARSFGYHYGVRRKVRINTISQSPTVTTAGTGIKGFGDFFDYANKMSPLGNASAEACADYCIALFSDLTRMVTMQNLFHDGGFSNMGMSPNLLA